METGAVVHERRVKTALRKGNLAEPFLASRFAFSPYMACGHGCAYCDGRAERYWVEGVFDRDIVARTNIVEILAKEVAEQRERSVVSVGSGISDAYQPVETSLHLMRGAAAVLAAHRYPVTLLTKSAEVARDLDRWSEVKTAVGFNLFVSLTFWRDLERAIFEPGASGVEERLQTLARFKAAGCGVGVYAMPLLPWISDTPVSVDALLNRCREAGADFVMPGGLTLRPGRQKDFFLSTLQKSHPHLLADYRELYGEERASGVCRLAYRQALEPRLTQALAKKGLPSRPPHALYRDRMPLYDELYVLLCHMTDLYRDRGRDVRRLVAGLDGYRGWLVERKTRFNRRRSETQADLEDELRWALSSGALAERIPNEKLLIFLRSVALDRRVFDYVKLELV